MFAAVKCVLTGSDNLILWPNIRKAKNPMPDFIGRALPIVE